MELLGKLKVSYDVTLLLWVFSDVSKEDIGLEVKAEKSKYIVMSC
jgi:hypothetical protein